MPVALKRDEILRESLSPEETVELNRLLVRMLSSAEAMQRYEADVLAGRVTAS